MSNLAIMQHHDHASSEDNQSVGISGHILVSPIHGFPALASLLLPIMKLDTTDLADKRIMASMYVCS